MIRLNRRFFIRAAAIAFGACLCFSPAFAQQSAGNKKVLFLTKSSGFQHSVITRMADNYDAPSHAERFLKEFGAKAGYDVTYTKDASLFNDPKTYDTYQVIAFYTTTDLTRPSEQPAFVKDANGRLRTDPSRKFPEKPMSPEGKELFLKAIADGKVGFIGFHCASDTFHSRNVPPDLMYDVGGKQHANVDPYIKMVGGEFQSHGAQQASDMLVTSKTFPGLENLQPFNLHEEWYAQINIAPDLHVILAHDTASMKNDRGVREWQYQRPNFPSTWARMEGKGRVFYTSMGHKESVWEDPIFQRITIAGLDWVSGKTQFDAKPNIKEATPEYQKFGQAPPRQPR